MKSDKASQTRNTRLKEFIVDDPERKRRIALKNLEITIRQEEKEKSKEKRSIMEERIFNINR